MTVNMYLTKKERTIKYTIYALIILLSALIQNVAGLWLEIGNARCFFLIPAAVVLGINEDEKTSALLGLFAGLLWDTVSSQHMGFNCVFLMLVCYITSALVTHLFRDAYRVSVISSISAVGVYCLLYWLLFVALPSKSPTAASLGYFYLPCFIYTSVMTLVIALILREIKAHLNKEYRLDE